MASKILIHTDGSCLGNPGPGGWAATLQFIKQGEVRAETTVSGYRPGTTNNQMELMAAISGLSALKSPGQNVEIITDSQYVIGALNGNRARKNKELIRCLRGLAAKHQITTRKVRGHSGHSGNEEVDDLARGAAEDLNTLLEHQTRVIVFGSRSFNDYQLLAHKLDCILANSTDIAIISGSAKGPDQLGEEYAIENGHGLIRVPALWDVYDKKAGFKRNDEMLDIATHAIGFWDGQSRGTRDMIQKTGKLGLPLRVIRI